MMTSGRIKQFHAVDASKWFRAPEFHHHWEDANGLHCKSSTWTPELTSDHHMQCWTYDLDFLAVKVKDCLSTGWWWRVSRPLSLRVPLLLSPWRKTAWKSGCKSPGGPYLCPVHTCTSAPGRGETRTRHSIPLIRRHSISPPGTSPLGSVRKDKAWGQCWFTVGPASQTLAQP